MLRQIFVTICVLMATSAFSMNVAQLNKASKAELMEIKGIGAAKADEILKERKKEKFTSIDDLVRVKGIGEKIVANVKNDIKSEAKTATQKI